MDNGASSYRRFLDGDESAFNEIMEELFRSLVFFINGYVHDIHAAEDIANLGARATSTHIPNSG